MRIGQPSPVYHGECLDERCWLEDATKIGAALDRGSIAEVACSADALLFKIEKAAIQNFPNALHMDCRPIFEYLLVQLESANFSFATRSEFIDEMKYRATRPLCFLSQVMSIQCSKTGIPSQGQADWVNRLCSLYDRTPIDQVNFRAELAFTWQIARYADCPNSSISAAVEALSALIENAPLQSGVSLIKGRVGGTPSPYSTSLFFWWLTLFASSDKRLFHQLARELSSNQDSHTPLARVDAFARLVWCGEDHQEGMALEFLIGVATTLNEPSATVDIQYGVGVRAIYHLDQLIDHPRPEISIRASQALIDVKARALTSRVYGDLRPRIPDSIRLSKRVGLNAPIHAERVHDVALKKLSEWRKSEYQRLKKYLLVERDRLRQLEGAQGTTQALSDWVCLRLSIGLGEAELQRLQSNFTFTPAEVVAVESDDQSLLLVHLIESAHQGDSGAQYRYGLHLEQGMGVAKSVEEAIFWYEEAAKYGHREAMFRAGICHDNARGTYEDKVRAFHYYLQAAQEGHIQAQYNLAWCYENGHGTSPDPGEALSWYRRSADSGHEKAQGKVREWNYRA